MQPPSIIDSQQIRRDTRHHPEGIGEGYATFLHEIPKTFVHADDGASEPSR